MKFNNFFSVVICQFFIFSPALSQFVWPTEADPSYGTSIITGTVGESRGNIRFHQGFDFSHYNFD